MTVRHSKEQPFNSARLRRSVMQIAFFHREPLAGVRRLRSSRPALPVRRMTALGALGVLLLAGCSNGGAAPSSVEGAVGGRTSLQDSAGGNIAPGYKSDPGAKSAPGAVSAPDGKPVPGAGAAAGPSEVAKRGPVPGVSPKLTKSASLDLQVKDIAAAAARVRSVATGLQAQVLSEQIGRGNPGDPIPLREGTESPGIPGDSADLGSFGTLTLSVPADRLDSALDQLAKVGTVLRRNASSQDVTAQYVDTESRLKTMRASVDRVRALMARAKDLGQVVALESEMSRRQADLESLESQRAELKTSAERSTLAVSLSTPTKADDPVTAGGFSDGLGAGWDAFTASASGLFTAIGAVLPFAVFFAVVGAPLVWWLRRRLPNRSRAVPSQPGPSGQPAPAP